MVLLLSEGQMSDHKGAALNLDSSHVKAHRSAAGGKGGSGRKRSGARVAVAPRKSIAWPMIVADRSPSR